MSGIDGRHMYLAPGNKQPLHELLLHHWQQAVLCNMKGRGPEFDIEVERDEGGDEGGDVMGQLSEMDGGKVMWEMMMADRWKIIRRFRYSRPFTLSFRDPFNCLNEREYRSGRQWVIS